MRQRLPQSQFAIEAATTTLRYLAVGLLILLGYRMIVRPIMTRHLGVGIEAPGPAVALPGGGQMSADGMPALEGGVERTGSDGAPAPKPFQRVDKSSSYAEQLDELRRIGKDDPRMVAMIIHNWIKQDG